VPLSYKGSAIFKVRDVRISSADQKANCFYASLIIDQVGGGVIASSEASDVDLDL
jgi:hypothetical protein